ncbi:hypothetical protein WN51_10280 [Melipona quadrifasciata]|uniref:Uncharacterized protein n=1 Tax=Melipona quadrifasciata TaxID=166423 RepID=A0A0M9A4Q1_9HYME|nr:hypothetical protein WN51_10280 [Melipona quadrifasciata]
MHMIFYIITILASNADSTEWKEFERFDERMELVSILEGIFREIHISTSLLKSERLKLEAVVKKYLLN